MPGMNMPGMEMPGMMRGMGPGMMARHTAPIPAAYIGRTVPADLDDDALARGGELYGSLCATCHGDGGMGDGPGGVALDPAPAAIAHTSQMMGDDYLFWRISEGGAADPFNSAMPAWQEGLTEAQRWELVAYVRALGTGQAQPGRMMGGMAYDPAAEALKRANMLATAVAEGVISAEESTLFDHVHSHIDAMQGSDRARQGGMRDVMGKLVDELVATGDMTQADADLFWDIHDRLVAAGLMQ